MTTLAERELLFGHTDEENAYLVDDYPYGFRLRTQIRYWLESKAGRGDRFVSQTMNPKTGRWNKPKRSTYTGVAVMFIDEEQHVRWTGIDFNNSAEWLAEFVGVVGRERLNDLQRARLAEIIGYTRAMEHVTFEVVSVDSMTAEEKAERDAEQELVKRRVAMLISIETDKATTALEE